MFDEDTEYRSIFETPLFPPAFYSSHNFGERYLRLFVSPGISKPNPRKPDPTYLGGDLSSRSSRLAEVVSFLSVCCSHAASQPARLGCCNKEEEKFGWLVGSLTHSVRICLDEKKKRKRRYNLLPPNPHSLTMSIVRPPVHLSARAWLRMLRIRKTGRRTDGRTVVCFLSIPKQKIPDF